MEEKQDVVWNYEGEKIELDTVCRDLEVLEEERLVQLESGDEELSGSAVQLHPLMNCSFVFVKRPL